MIKYEYDAVAVGSWRQKGSGIATFLEELNSAKQSRMAGEI